MEWTLEQFDQARAESAARLETRRRFLAAGETPSMPFVIDFLNGVKGEAVSPLYLLDLLIDPAFSDIDDPETIHVVMFSFLKDIARVRLSSDRKTVIVHANGVLYDSGEGSEDMVLDSFDAWTVVASLVRSGCIRLYEKIPVWTDAVKIQGCAKCVFRKDSYCTVWETNMFGHWETACPFVANGNTYDEYREVNGINLTNPYYKPEWKPIAERIN